MKKLFSLKRVILGFIVILVVSLVTFGYIASNAQTSLIDIEQRTRAFVYHTSQESYETAYDDFLAVETKKEVNYPEFKDKLQYPQGIFSDITDVETMTYGYQQNLGQPAIFKYYAIVTYNDGYKGNLEAIYVKEDNQWKIVSFWITPETERLKKFTSLK